MEICKDCLHKEVCMYRAGALLGEVLVDECDSYLAPSQPVDIYKMADTITSTVKQVVLANLRNICDEEGD